MDPTAFANNAEDTRPLSHAEKTRQPQLQQFARNGRLLIH